MRADEQKLKAACLETLAAQGRSDCVGLGEVLDRYCELIRKWNGYASLVSEGDAGRLWEHIGDSLSLIEAVQREGGEVPRLFDIGSGAGFPAIPVALALAEVRVVLVERSRKKAGFLENALGELGLVGRVKVEQGAFPQEAGLQEAAGWVVTARAVEKPEQVWRGIRELVTAGAVFLCQWAEVPQEAGKMFHVEHLTDDWGRGGLRRGELRIIRSR